MQVRRYAGAADADGIARVRQAVRGADGDVWLPGPDCDEGPEEACCVVEADGTVVGFSWLVRWVEDDGTVVFLVTGCVDPVHRGRGHGTAMLQRQEAHARSLHPGTDPAVLAGNADDTQPGAQRLLVDNGYRPDFTVVRLDRPVDVSVAQEPAELPPGVELRAVRPEHQPKIHAAIEECFRGAGHGLEPLDYPTYLAGVRDTDLWVVAWDGADVVGLVTNERQPDGSVDSPWVAVRPPYRRRGLATALLKGSLVTMWRHGIAVASIRTIAENKNNTVALYEDVGYRVVRRMPRFRKPLHPAP
jgi:GNAT superfamily N-acetyltransferase